MRLEIDIAEHHYNNIMALDSVSLGRVPYKGIIMYAVNAIKRGKALEQEPNTWSLDDAREDFMSDVYNTLDFLPTNNEANRIIDSFDRVTSGIKKEPILNKIRAEIVDLGQRTMNDNRASGIWACRDIIDKYIAESEEV